MTKIVTPNYSPAQVSLIESAIAANGGVANKSVAETLSANPEMDTDGAPRKVRSIIAKMRRVVDASEGEFSYEKVTATTKSGQPVQKKLDLVARIATLADVSPSKLEGMEKSPKGALETLVAALAA